MISISTSHTFRSWVAICHFRRLMAFLSLNLYDTPGLLPRINVLFWGTGDFPVGYARGIHHGTLEIVIQEVLCSIRVSYSAIWSPPLMNVKWHSDRWPIETSQPIRLSTNFMTLIPCLTFIWLCVVSIEYLQRVWHASRKAHHSGHLVPSPFWGRACVPSVETRFLELAMSFLDFSHWFPFGTFSILLVI